MKYLLALFLSAYSIAVSGQRQDWQPHNVFDLATLEFPLEPECLDTLGQHVCRCKNDLGTFAAIVINIGDQVPVSDKDLSDLYRGVTTSMAEKSGGGHISEQQDFFYKKLRGIEFTLSSDDYSVNRYHKVLVVGPNTLLCVYSPETPDAEAALKAKNHFFNSLVVTAKASDILRSTSSAYNTGYRFGKLIGALFVVAAVIAGIFFLVMALKRRK